MTVTLFDRYDFKPRLWPTVICAVGLALTVTAAFWQFSRAQHKRELGQHLAALNRDSPVRLSAATVGPQSVRFRRVEVRGRFAPKYTIYLDNKVLDGVAGYDVVTPLEIGSSTKYVLVNRGWVPAAGDRQVPDVPTPQGEVKVTGLAVVPSKRFIELSSDVRQGRIWENLTIERYRQHMPLDIQPVVIRQQNAFADGLVRKWEAPDLGMDRNYGYAFQWTVFSLLIIVYYVLVHVSRKPET
ncbi:MAG TPA: SURF1 family protein [Burkholderiales bacterium]|nr:SURF1 family protein [Burkholderiales bacterium]